MVAFFTVLFLLLALNAVLLIFSVNGATKIFRKSSQKAQEESVTQLLPKETSKVKYKKAV